MALKTVVGRVLSALLALENALVIVIGLTGVVIWFSGQVAEGGPSEWGVLLVYWVTFSRRVTVTFLILGGLAWLLMRVRSRTLAPPIGEDPMGSQDRLFLVTAILMVHGALAALFARPLLPLFRDNIGLLQSWGVLDGLQRGGDFSGIFLVPAMGILFAPGLAAMTALSFITGAAAPVWHLLMGLEESTRVLLRSLCLQVAFLLGLLFARDLFEAAGRTFTEGFTGPDGLEWKAHVLPWLTGQATVLASVAQRLAWLLPGFLICAAVVLRKAHAKQLMDAETGIQSPGQIPTEESSQIELPVRILGTEERSKYKRYLIKWKFLSYPFYYKTFEVYDQDNSLAFVTRMNGLSLLTRDIEVYLAGNEKIETFSIVGRRFIRFPDRFDMTYCPTHQRVGSFQKSPSGWVIMNESGRQIAEMKLEEAAWGFAKCQIVIGHLSVCKYLFQHIMRPTMTIEFPDDPPTDFDRNLGIGLGLVLCFQAVAFNDTYVNS